jgi:hypothetical protein
VRIAYLINHYPAVSHTFIRREILALEKLGCEVMRIALRGWDQELVDGDDRKERERTRYALDANALTLVFAVVRTLLRHPIGLMRVATPADAMRKCLEAPPDLITRMGEAGRERALARHDAITEAAKPRNLFYLAGSKLHDSC